VLRSEMLSALDEDYVRTARAKGVSERNCSGPSRRGSLILA